MTVPIDKVREEFAGDALTTVFPTTLLATAETQVEVWDLDETVTPAVVTQLLLGIGCTVTLTTPLALPSTLQVDISATHPTGLPVNHTLIVIRRHPLTQDQVIPPADRFPESVIELVLDRATLQAQYAKWLAERALVAAVEDPDGLDLSLPSVADRASKILLFDALGKPTAADLSTLSPGSIVVAALGQSLLPDNSVASWRAQLAVMQRSATWLRCDAGPQASRPAAGAFGLGVYLETDSLRVFYSNGSVWLEMAVPRFSNASLPTPSATTAGMLVADTDLEELRLVTATERRLVRPLPPNAQQGQTLDWTSATGVTMSAGIVRSAGDEANINLAASMAKILNLAGTWTAGAAGNMRPSTVALVANTWYPVFSIGGIGATTDWGIDEAGNATTATKLLAAAGGSFNRFRRRGWILLDGSAAQIVEFVQDEDDFWWATPQTQTVGSADYTVAGGANATVARVVPPGPGIRGLITAAFGGVGADFKALFGRVGQTLPTPNDSGSGASPGTVIAVQFGATAGSRVNGAHIAIHPDANGDIKIKATGDSSTTFIPTAYEWRDRRY